jgi:hypothetical protein
MKIEIDTKAVEENIVNVRDLKEGSLFVFTTSSFLLADVIMIKVMDIYGYSAAYLCLSTGILYDSHVEETIDLSVKDVSEQFILKGWL